MRSSLKKKFLNTINEHKMLSAGDSILIAVSGGVDSTVMAYLFNEIRDEFDLTLYAFHLNHLLRPKEAEKEAKFVKNLCDDLKINAFINEYNVSEYAKKNSLSTQVAARQVRYRFLADIKNKHNINKIATAHTADDQVETVLIRLLRGTAGAHAAGIAPVRDGHIIRPMIDILKKEVEDYAKASDISYMTDSSNLKTVYLRNKVRLELIPYIKQNFSRNITKNILNFSNVMNYENEFIDLSADNIFKKALIKQTDDAISFAVPKLRRADKALKNRIITKAYYTFARQGCSLTYNHIAKVNYIIAAKAPNLSYKLPGGVSVQRSYDVLTFTVNPTTYNDYEYSHNLGDKTYITDAGVTIRSKSVQGDILKLMRGRKANEEYIDAAKLKFPLTIRNFKDGDAIRPLNMKGTKKLKNLFIDKKLPRGTRRTVPILICTGKIILVPGVCLSDDFKVTGDTKEAVVITIEFG